MMMANALEYLTEGKAVDDELIDLLESLLSHEVSALYIAGTLIGKFGEDMLEFEITDPHTDYIRMLISSIYLDHKTPKHMLWNQALDTLLTYDCVYNTNHSLPFIDKDDKE